MERALRRHRGMRGLKAAKRAMLGCLFLRAHWYTEPETGLTSRYLRTTIRVGYSTAASEWSPRVRGIRAAAPGASVR